jgi:hypothetical protein
VEASRLPGTREGERLPPGEAPWIAARPVPRWLVIVGSVVILFHLIAVGARVLAVPSGPWPSPMEGATIMTPPQFAYSLLYNSDPQGTPEQQQNLARQQTLVSHYLNGLHLTNNYHFGSNRPGQPGVRFEIRLKDKDGNLIEVVRFPDDKANAWVQHRQKLLADNLVDEPVMPPQGENIAAPGRKAPTIDIWEPAGGEQKPGAGQNLVLKTIETHLTPRDRPVFRPSDWAQLMAKAYCRRLCRVYGAAKAELIRQSRDPYPPMILTIDAPPTDAFADLTSNFGEVTMEVKR